MNLTDIPQSGVYIQQGAVFQLVAQILDYSTGLPVQLQTAAGLSITVSYPDAVTSQTFTASLYTDGSDGMIVYTTKNNGTTVDLLEQGLYHFQGNAVINGVQMPPSYADDFYVLPNLTGNPSPPQVFGSSALILFDPNGIRWALTVSPSGLNPPAATPSGPASFLMFNNLTMVDSDGIFWSVKISITGVIQTVIVGQTTGALEEFILTDTNGRSWVITISTSGVIGAA